MTTEMFLDGVQKNAARVKDYVTGHDGSDGGCDCVGLIIGVVRLCGTKYTEIHGSNWYARHWTSKLHEIVTPGDLQLGDLVYKGREIWDDNYDLPARYANDPDQTDYCHIGVVTGVNPLEITHPVKIRTRIAR